MMPNNGAAWIGRLGLRGEMLVLGSSGLFRVK